MRKRVPVLMSGFSIRCWFPGSEAYRGVQHAATGQIEGPLHEGNESNIRYLSDVLSSSMCTATLRYVAPQHSATERIEGPVYTPTQTNNAWHNYVNIRLVE
jgi:hypothetical protein